MCLTQSKYKYRNGAIFVSSPRYHSEIDFELGSSDSGCLPHVPWCCIRSDGHKKRCTRRSIQLSACTWPVYKTLTSSSSSSNSVWSDIASFYSRSASNFSPCSDVHFESATWSLSNDFFAISRHRIVHFSNSLPSICNFVSFSM